MMPIPIGFVFCYTSKPKQENLNKDHFKKSFDDFSVALSHGQQCVGNSTHLLMSREAIWNHRMQVFCAEVYQYVLCIFYCCIS